MTVGTFEAWGGGWGILFGGGAGGEPSTGKKKNNICLYIYIYVDLAADADQDRQRMSVLYRAFCNFYSSLGDSKERMRPRITSNSPFLTK